MSMFDVSRVSVDVGDSQISFETGKLAKQAGGAVVVQAGDTMVRDERIFAGGPGAPPEAARAEAHYRQALALAGELGMRPLVAHCYLGLGKLYWRTGKRHEAQEHLNTATTMYREMDMRSWLEQAEREA